MTKMSRFLSRLLALSLFVSGIVGCHSPQPALSAEYCANETDRGPSSHRLGAAVSITTQPLSGQLSGYLWSPSVTGVTETGGPTSLAISAISDGQILKRSSGVITGVTLSTGYIFLSAASCWPSITNGASTIAQIESTTNKQNTFVADFLQSVQSYVEWETVLAGDYDGGTATAVVNWMANSASTNSVVWGVACLAFADGDAQDTSYGAAQQVTDANQGTNIVNVTAATGAITCAGTPSAGKRLKVRAYRLGSGSDNLAATARLMSVKLAYSKAAP